MANHLHPLPQPGKGIPRGLRGKARTFYAGVLRNFHLEDHHLELLAQGCWALQRAEDARERVSVEGMTYTDEKTGRLFPHPCCTIERESRTLFVRIVRELGLDLSEVAEARPPSRSGRPQR